MPTVTIGGVDYPAFTDVATANTYLAADFARAAKWAARTDDQKGQGIVSATRVLMSLFAQSSCVATPTTDVPTQPVMDVTAMLAADGLAKPALFADASGNSNIKSAKAGSAAVEYFRTDGGLPPLPIAMWSILRTAQLVDCGPVTAGEDGAYVSGSDYCRTPLRDYWNTGYPGYPNRRDGDGW